MLEGLVLLIGLIFLLPIGSFVLALIQRDRHSKLSLRADELGRRLDLLSREVRTLRRRLDQVAGQPIATPEAVTPEAAPRAEPAPPQPPQEPAKSAVPSPPSLAPPRVTAAAQRVAPPHRTPAPQPSRTTNGWGLEQLFGTRGAVWLGAVALALAGAFLVKYSIDQGLIGPHARVALGLGFGVSLLGVAEWLRGRTAGIAQGLAAAGIAVLYAALLAGTRLYGLFPPLVGGLGMAVTTATAVVMSLRHGQLVAILGLLGGFLTPIWIGSETPRPWMLMFYLLLVQSGLFIVSRRMRWVPVAGLTSLAAMVWTVLWLSDLTTVGGGTTAVGLFLLGSIGAVVLAVGLGQGAGGWGDRKVAQILVGSAAGLGVMLMTAVVGVGDYGWTEWTFFAILGAGCLLLARRDSAFEALPWLAAAATAGTLLFWGHGLDPAGYLDFWKASVGFGLLYVAGSYFAMWGAPKPERWAALSAVSGIAYLLLAYQRLHGVAFPIPWGVQALAVAGLLATFAVAVARNRARMANGGATLAAFVLGTLALVTIAVPMELERAWIGVAWALEIPLFAWIVHRLRLPVLEKVVLVLGGMVAVRLLLNPAVLEYPIGETVVFNWTLFGYGIPALALLLTAMLYRGLRRGYLADALESGAIALGFAFLTLNVRQAYHPADLGAHGVTLQEWGALTVVWLLYALGLFGLHRWSGLQAHKTLAAVCGLVALAQGLLAQGFAASPMLHAYTVGDTPVFNSLLFVYGLPALLALALAGEFRRLRESFGTVLAGSASLIFAFLTLTFEVRQAFHGTVLSAGETTNAEMYTYSLVWILFATGLLVAGILTRGVVLRYGSAAVMLLAVGKVFLVDTAHLQDLYRVFSLFGLGVSLMLLAFLYQKFVFGSDPQPNT